MKRTIVFLLLAFISTGLFAHGDLHERIKKVSKQIEKNPKNAKLYLKRGELYYHHEDFEKALEDYNTCEGLGHEGIRLDFNIASTRYQLEHYESALAVINAILVKEKKLPDAWRLKGNVHMKLKQYEVAAHAFEKVIFHSKKAIPEIYFLASNAWEKMGTEVGQANSIEALLSGIESLGELNTFYKRIVELNMKYENYVSALYYQSIQLNKAKRKERAYFKRAKIYLLLGDQGRAKNDLVAAKGAIEQLNGHMKKTRATKALITLIDDELKNI